MTTYTIVRCDQCQAEAEGVMPEGWHPIAITNLITSQQRHLHICPSCWAAVKVAELCP